MGLLQRAKTPKQRLKIAAKVGTDDKRVLDWVTAADRMRVKGVGWEYSELFRPPASTPSTNSSSAIQQKLVDRMAEINRRRNLVHLCPRSPCHAGSRAPRGCRRLSATDGLIFCFLPYLTCRKRKRHCWKRKRWHGYEFKSSCFFRARPGIAIRQVGPQFCILASDLGQVGNPLHPDGLAAFIEQLSEHRILPSRAGYDDEDESGQSAGDVNASRERLPKPACSVAAALLGTELLRARAGRASSARLQRLETAPPVGNRPHNAAVGGRRLSEWVRARNSRQACAGRCVARCLAARNRSAVETHSVAHAGAKVFRRGRRRGEECP